MGIKMEIQNDELLGLNLLEMDTEAADKPVTNVIVESAEKECMRKITDGISITKCADRTLDTGEDPAQPVLGGEDVVHHTPQKAVVSRLKPWHACYFPSILPVNIRMFTF